MRPTSGPRNLLPPVPRYPESSPSIAVPMALAVLDGAHNLEAAFLSNAQALPVELHIFASTTIGNYILPSLLARFKARVPAARLELQIGNTLDVVTAVRAFRAGKAIGQGYLELTGYGKPVQL